MGKWEKIKLRKMYLTMFLKEAYILFKQDNPEIEIGFSTFCKLRPKNVLLMHQTPSDQCKCLTCENFFLKLRALNIDYQEFWKTYLCNDSLDSSCWKGFCSNCCAGKKLETSVDHNKEKIKMKQWFKVENKPTCKDDVYTKAEIFGMLQNSFNSVSTHINTKRIQSEAFLSDKTDAKVRVLQLDFAMNYSCEYQNEIQSALWTRGSVCLFTAASIHNDECQTFAICSDTSTKDKNTIACFIKHLYENELLAVPEMWDDVEEVIWTDGPSSEFKNRYMVYLCQQLSLQFKKPFTWKYFATSHGKGIVDGVGGRIKSIVRTSVMSKKKDAPIVQNAKEFADVAKKLMKNTKIHLILDSEISRDDSVWIKAKKVDGISKAHVVHCNGRTVNVYNNSYEQKADQSHAKCNRPMHSSSKVRKSIFHLVFSDSESEQSGEWSQLDDNFSEEDLNSELPETQGNQVKTNVEVDNVKNGTFLLAEFKGTQKNTSYRYLCVAESEVEEDGEVRVMCLKCMDSTRKKFIPDENDKSYIEFEQILKLFDTPQLKTKGERIFYEFPQPIDIFEKA